MQIGVLPDIALRLLNELMNEMQAEGLAVLRSGGLQPLELLCGLGQGVHEVVQAGYASFSKPRLNSRSRELVGGRPVLIVSLALLDGCPGLLVLWRPAGAALWDVQDQGTAVAMAVAVRVFWASQAECEVSYDLIDPLTRLPGQAVFLDEAGRQLGRLDREALPGTLILVDIDAFHTLEPALGRLATDRLLLQIADLLRGTVRPTDLVARIAKESFAVWMAGADHLVAAERAEDLRRNPPTEIWRDEMIRQRPVTLSAGIVTRWPGSGQRIAALLQRARLAVEKAKSLGGAQWCVAPDPAAPIS